MCAISLSSRFPLALGSPVTTRTLQIACCGVDSRDIVQAGNQIRAGLGSVVSAHSQRRDGSRRGAGSGRAGAGFSRSTRLGRKSPGFRFSGSGQVSLCRGIAQ